MARGLTVKQQAFVREYLRTRNILQAARSAGVRHPKSTAYRMMKSQAVQAAIEEGLNGADARLAKESEKALGILYDLMENAQTDSVRLRAAQEILDRAREVLAGDKADGSGGGGRENTLIDYTDPAAVSARVKELRERLAARQGDVKEDEA